MRARSVLAGLATLLAAGAITTPRADAAIAFTPCAPAGYQCGSLAVPLDPAGSVGGAINLSVKRKVAASNPTLSAVIGLAGGPGQAAIPFAAKIERNIAPALTTRDLVVFDQRGTGASNQLRCPGTSTPSSCANRIGPSRAFFRTAESVEDIEQIRVQGGYSKLVLYGTSYGTKVAEAYASKYPQNVEALVLDSVVLPEGPDVFDRSTLQRVGPALRALCAANRCRGITGDPRGDMAALVRRLERTPIRGPVVTSTGHTIRRSLTATDIVDVLLQGDFDPSLRADMPAAVRSALRGDVRPILRLRERAGAGEATDDTISVGLFATTTCEEGAFPWDHADPPQIRADEAVRAAQNIPRAQLGPFDARVALLSGTAPLCVTWPNAAPNPVASGPLPNVPTLVISGEADLRTPLTDARRLAARIPDAQFIAVPFTGHSVLGGDTTGCAQRAVAAFFAGQVVQPCTTTTPQFAPTALAPTRLGALPGAGRAGKTVRAVERTLADIGEDFLGVAADLRKAPRVGTQIGGLRAGFARWTATGIRLAHLQYVPGVTVTGFSQRGGTTRVTVSGADSAHGTVRILAGGQVIARLGGRRITGRVPAGTLARAAAAASVAPSGYVAREPRVALR